MLDVFPGGLLEQNILLFIFMLGLAAIQTQRQPDKGRRRTQQRPYDQNQPTNVHLYLAYPYSFSSKYTPNVPVIKTSKDTAITCTRLFMMLCLLKGLRPMAIMPLRIPTQSTPKATKALIAKTASAAYIRTAGKFLPATLSATLFRKDGTATSFLLNGLRPGAI